jgi:Enoyl-(Acyl carrier protein) reductase
MPETRTIQQTLDNTVKTLGVRPEHIMSMLEQKTLLGRLSTVADTARLAAFLASDGAQTITGAIVNASSGAVMDRSLRRTQAPLVLPVVSFRVEQLQTTLRRTDDVRDCPRTDD